MLAGVWLRYANLLSKPYGLHTGEIADLRIVKSIQQGDIRVFYPLETDFGRESLLHGIVAPFQIIFQHPTLSFHAVSVWSALITMSLLYLWVRRFFGRLASLVAVSFWSFSFAVVLLNRTIGRENLMGIPIFLTLLILSESSRPAESTRGNRDLHRVKYFFLSVILGISLYLHPDAISLILATLLLVFIGFRRNIQDIRKNWPYFLLTLFLLLIFALPYMISTAQNTELAGISRWLPIPEEDGRLWWYINRVIDQLFGLVIGADRDLRMHIPGEPLLNPLFAIFLFVGIVHCIRNWRKAHSQLLLLLSAALAIPQWMAATPTAYDTQLTFLFVIPIYGGIGVKTAHQWLKRMGIQQNLLKSAIVLILIFTLVYTHDGVFRRWPSAEGWNEVFNRETQVLAKHLDESAHQLPTVFCGTPSISAPERLNQVDILQLMLNEDDLPIRYVDCTQGLVLPGGGQKQQYVLTDPAALEDMPVWFQGWLEEYGSSQEIGAGLDFPISDQVIRFDVTEPLANLLGNFTTTRPLRFPRESENTIAPAVRFGGNLTFLGYDFASDGPYTPGDTVQIDLFWRIDGSVPKDIHLYMHLVFHEGDLANITAQVDSVSVDPESLQARDIWLHRAKLELPYTMPEGDYLLLLGAYTQQSGDRMPVYDKGEGSHIRGDYLLLPDIPVIAADSSGE